MKRIGVASYVALGLVSCACAVDIRVECPQPGIWSLAHEKTSDGAIEEFVIRLSASMPAIPPRFEVTFDVPQLDAHHKWKADAETEKVTLPPNWDCKTESRLCRGMPLVSFVNDNDRNRILVAASEAKRTVEIEAGIREEDCRLVWKLSFFTEPEDAISSWAVRIRVDRRDCFFGDAIREGVDWIGRTAGMSAAKAPACAFDPLYSAWYSFHQDVNAAEIEAECAEAAKLGLRTLIVDDGWQTDDNNRGYAFTGDWELSRRRFPDMAAHVKHVHDLGVKYMIWYGVPMMGIMAKNYNRFNGKYLWTQNDRWSGYSCLDPRFPEVRDYICGIYEKAVREWDLDGLKLDFVDLIAFRGEDPAVKENYAGRDVKALPEAVDRLLSDIYTRMTAIKSDFLFEFRQSYIGPAVRQYGNMMRAADCPGDLLANRCRTANLRLTSGESAVHSDMLEWSLEETPENAARFILSSIFSVVQYSIMLRNLPEGHRRMLSHWIRFSQEHRDALLKGEFRPHHFEAFYPWIEAWNEQERIVGVYLGGVAIHVDQKTNFILNGTGTEKLLLDLAKPARISVYDTFGRNRGKRDCPAGLNVVETPESGFVKVFATSL